MKSDSLRRVTNDLGDTSPAQPPEVENLQNNTAERKKYGRGMNKLKQEGKKDRERAEKELSGEERNASRILVRGISGK
jgi:hypothetical protein